jgi:hypothetical protein
MDYSNIKNWGLKVTPVSSRPCGDVYTTCTSSGLKTLPSCVN